MQNINNRELLTKEWDEIYQSKDAKFILVGNIEGYKFRKEGNHYLVYNKSLTHKK